MPYYQDGNITLYSGDLHDVLPANIPESSIDYVLTDPPYLLNFMGKEWDKGGGDIPTNQLVFRSWFAGLVTGEGYFRIHRERDGAYYACHFGIHMRADEKPMLVALSRKLGIGHVEDEPATDGLIKSAPSARWSVESREDCWKLARVLDGTPLYGKKQREYDLWRKALQVWTDTPKGNRWKGPRDNTAMESLWEEMKTLRPFDQELADSAFNPFGQPDYLFHYRWAKECLRVVKPGGLLLAFGGTRTWHRLACAIEDAGWEIRDTLMWLHSMGFPKSADVGKMIDKAKGAKREVVGTKMGLPGYTLSPNTGGSSYNQGVSGHTSEERIKTVEITAPATDLAKLWTGWTLALKPAWEPIVLAMKPMEGTIAQNAEQWGVAGMNIDACRIGPCPGYKYNADRNGTTFHGKQGERIKQSAAKKGAATIEATKGRWPANVLLDEIQTEILVLKGGLPDEIVRVIKEYYGYCSQVSNLREEDTDVAQSGEKRTREILQPGGRRHAGRAKRLFQESRAKPRNNGDFKSPSKGAEKAHVTHGHEDEGGASRFFYCAKSSKREKGR